MEGLFTHIKLHFPTINIPKSIFEPSMDAFFLESRTTLSEFQKLVFKCKEYKGKCSKQKIKGWIFK